jgi:hypothetical protein
MAVVGHAEIVVRALTDRVEKDIRDGFSKAATSASQAGRDIGENLADGINRGTGGIRLKTLRGDFLDTLERSTDLADAFTSLTRKSYAVQAGIGALVGSIGALVGGLGALIGVAGGAAASIVAVGSAAITAKVGLSIAKLALGGVGQAVSAATKANGGYSKSLKQIAFDAEEAALSVDRAAINLENARESVLRTQDLPSGSRVRREAELAYREAELAYRRAQDAKKAGQNTGQGGQDPYANLTPSQKKFAQYLASLKPIMADLKEAAASGFLPILQTQLERLIAAKLPEILEEKFKKLGAAAGRAVENFTDILLSGDNLKDFQKVLDNMATTLPKFGTVLGNVFSSFLSILEAAEPLTQRFVGFLEKKSNAFKNFLDTKQSSGELTGFFSQAGELASRFGSIFGNIFGGFGKIIQANFGPGSGGDTLLTWLESATQGFENMDVVGLQTYFKGAADNFVAMSQAIGGAIESIIKAGSDPAIKEFWDTLGRGSFAFQQIINESVKSAPSLAVFLKTITEIIAIFADSGQVKAFFDTLNFALGGFLQVARALKDVINFVGPIFATISALTLLGAILFKTTAIFFGFTLKMIASTAAMLGMNAQAVLLRLGLLQLVPASAASGAAMTLALGPVGIAVAAIVAAVVALASAFNAIGAANMEKATKGVTQSFKEGAGATEVWNQALLSQTDAMKPYIADIKLIKKNINELSYAQKDYTNSNIRTTALADTFGAMGRALADVAVNDLPAAQKSFRNFTKEVGLNNDEVRVALDEMDEYKQALIDQADAIGIKVRNQMGEIDMQRLTNFALGEGEIALRRATEAQAEFDRAVDAGAASFIDYQGSLKQNRADVLDWAKTQAANTKDASDSWEDYWDGQEFSMDKYLDDLKKQATAAREWRNNIAKLTGELPAEILRKVADMGEAGAQLVAGLTDGVNDVEERRRFVESFGAIGFDAGSALSAGFNKSLPKGVSLRQLMDKGTGGKKDGGYIGRDIKKFALGGFVSGAGTARSDSIPTMLSNGEFVVNARATAENRSLLEAINANKSVASSPNIYMTVNASPGMDEKELANIVSRKIAFAMTKGGY